MVGAIHAPVVSGHGHGPSAIVVNGTRIAIGVIVGFALALTIAALTDTDLSDKGPFSAPTEMCHFNTFNAPDLVSVSAAQQAVPPMVSKCNYLFKERQYIAVGYRI